MLEFILKGGPLMWPLIICSILSLAIIFERGYVFYRARRDITGNCSLIRDALRSSERGPLTQIREELPDALAGICDTTGDEQASLEEKEHRLSRQAGIIIRSLEKNLRGLAIIGNITPIIGLLGTVTGMIRAFIAIQELGGQVDASVLAGGIWEALITTAAGLSIAIPTQIAYHYFEGRADDIAEDLHDTCHELVDTATHRG